jgi:galactokinase
MNVNDLYTSFFNQEPQITAFAPGRINLIGEHVDYNEGLVLPVAIHLGITIAAGPSPDDRCHLISAELGPGDPFTLPPSNPAPQSWSKYPAAIAWALGAQTPLNFAITSTLPAAGCGLSSSAALLIATATIWNNVDRLAHSPTKLAQIAQLAENQYVGVNCGIMDQLASACGVQNAALLIDIPTLQITPIAVPTGISLVILDTGVPRSLAESGYNQRRAQCEEACRILDVPSLRDAEFEHTNLIINPTIKKRARHVISEIHRVQKFADALAFADLPQLGSLMAASHDSLKNDYEVSCPELDAIVQAALASPGCVGARLTGAGFGGAAITLVQTEFLNDFIQSTEQIYQSEVQNYQPTIIPVEPNQGAQILQRSEF